ncbi:CapA family protein [Gillisia sp. Q332]|uniref:CapA family protein n=1 Tax=Gillisia xinjiangensis TaxID=3384765 RepID=UPI00391C075B
MVKIVIGGDICPTIRDRAAFIKGDTIGLWGDLLPVFKSADFVVANLETPLATKESPINKSGALFLNPPEILNAIKEAGINFLNLSNNHILDHGQEGLTSTIRSLNEANLIFSGAGENLEEASRPYSTDIQDKRISVISYAEHEFSIAENGKGGANPLNLMDFITRIQKLKKTSDFIILLYHGGKENYMLPTPNQQELCRFFIDQGVDTVICQHSHVAGCYENYSKGKIFYGQGNFIFDPYPLKKEWLYSGFLIEMDLFPNNDVKYNLIPYVHKSLQNNEIGIRKMNQTEALDFFKKIEEKNSKIVEPEYVIQQWNDLSLQLQPIYLSVLNGNGSLLRKFNEYFPWLNWIYSGKRKNTLQNIINCETHREMVITILKNKV